MNRKRENENSPESNEKNKKVHTELANPKCIFDEYPIIIPTELITINACAFNHKNTLMLVTGYIIGVPFSSTYIRQIYTTEGYLVTTLIPDYYIEASSNESLAFCEHFVLYLEFIPQTNMHFEGECAFRCGDLQLSHENEYNFRFLADIFILSSHLFLESDKSDNIYINGGEGNVIAVYDSNLEFTGNLEFSCIEKGSDIISIGIHDDYFVVLKYLNGVHWIHILRLSTREHIETTKIENPQQCYPHRMSFHDINHILIYNSSIRSISVWHHEGATQHYILPMVSGIMDDNEAHFYVRLAIMNNQLIGVTEQGYIIIYNII